MNKSNQIPLENECQVCGEPLIFVPHYEYDGVTVNGSYEPYYECPNGCAYPDCPDNELTAEELLTRGKVDTDTEFGIINFSDFQKGVITL